MGGAGGRYCLHAQAYAVRRRRGRRAEASIVDGVKNRTQCGSPQPPPGGGLQLARSSQAPPLGCGPVSPSRASMCRSTSQTSAGRSFAPRRLATRVRSQRALRKLRLRERVVPAVRCRSLASAKARNSRLLAACASQAAAPRKGRTCCSMSQPRLCEGPQLASARCVCFASCGSE